MVLISEFEQTKMYFVAPYLLSEHVRNSNVWKTRLASLVGITERETGVGKIGWNGNSTDLTEKIIFLYFAYRTKKKDLLISLNYPIIHPVSRFQILFKKDFERNIRCSFQIPYQNSRTSLVCLLWLSLFS